MQSAKKTTVKTLVFLCGVILIPPVFAQDFAKQNAEMARQTDAYRFALEKQRREFEIGLSRSDDARSYASELKKPFENMWKSTSRKDLLITNQMVVLDSDGKIIESKTLKSSGVKEEDASIVSFLANYKFRALPKSLDKMQLDIKFMSDGSMNLVEITTPQRVAPPYVAPVNPAPDFGPYMADLQRRIKRAWFPPKGYESKRIIVAFEIDKQGQVSNVNLRSPSGIPIVDEAAMSAITKAAPFRPFPQGAPDRKKLEFTFDYNVFAGGGRGVFADR